MATLYDQQGTEIYAGRGKYSHRARQMIERREAYTRSEEGALSVYVPAVQTPEPQRASTLQEDARTLKRDAQATWATTRSWLGRNRSSPGNTLKASWSHISSN